jgi:hypothetical protein
MDCIECKAANPDGTAYCGKCGAELGHTLDETVRKKDFRDRQATEMEITEAVASRLLKWGGWLGGIAALILASFGFALNLVYRDTRTALDTGKTQIESAVADGKNNINNAVAQGKNNIADATKDIGAIRQNADDLGKQVSQLRTEIKGYKEVNGEMETLQKQFHGQTSDLTKLDLRVHSLEAVGISGEPTSLSFGPNIGCPPAALAKGAKVAYCAQGNPPLLYQRTAGGDLRPVSSLSPVGFQDASLPGRKPGCSEASRGTFYVEKGMGKIADKPLLCVRQSDNNYGWIELAR